MRGLKHNSFSKQPNQIYQKEIYIIQYDQNCTFKGNCWSFAERTGIAKSFFISDFKKMEKLKQQFDVAMASLSEAKRFLIPLEQTERVQDGLTLGNSEILCQISFTK